MKLVEVPVTTPNAGVMCQSELVILSKMNGKLYRIHDLELSAGYGYESTKLALNRLTAKGLVKRFKVQHGIGVNRLGRDLYYKKANCDA